MHLPRAVGIFRISLSMPHRVTAEITFLTTLPCRGLKHCELEIPLFSVAVVIRNLQKLENILGKSRLFRYATVISVLILQEHDLAQSVSC